MRSFSTASATSQMNRSPSACLTGTSCSSRFGVLGTILGIFEVSGTVSRDSGFQEPFGVLGTAPRIRGIRNQTSGFQAQLFGVSGTILRGIRNLLSKLHKGDQRVRPDSPSRNTT